MSQYTQNSDFNQSSISTQGDETNAEELQDAIDRYYAVKNTRDCLATHLRIVTYFEQPILDSLEAVEREHVCVEQDLKALMEKARQKKKSPYQLVQIEPQQQAIGEISPNANNQGFHQQVSNIYPQQQFESQSQQEEHDPTLTIPNSIRHVQVPSEIRTQPSPHKYN